MKLASNILSQSSPKGGSRHTAETSDYFSDEVHYQLQITMKFALVAFALVTVAAAAVPTRSLEDDLQDIAAVIPVDKLRAIVRKYLDSDPEVQEIVAYLQGSEWAALVAEVAVHPTWVAFKEYLAEAGVDIEAIIQAIHDLITGAGRHPKSPTARGIKDMVDEIGEAFPTDAVLSVIIEKLVSSPEFLELFQKISSETAHSFVDDIRAIPEVQRLAQELRDRGLDVDGAIDAIYGIFGWSK
ncbi:hypothetical protein Trydic_g859 [Trypoxylus dichotomus]